METSQEEPANHPTRREIIRKIAKNSVYTVPLIITFSKTSLARAHYPSGGRRYHGEDS